MICPDKMQHALRALNRILIEARWLAHEAGADEVARLLDEAEILPKYIIQDGDATQEFRSALAGIAQQHPACTGILAEFEQETVPKW